MYIAVGPAGMSSYTSSLLVCHLTNTDIIAYTSAALAQLGNTATTILPTSHYARTLSIDPSTVGAIISVIGLLGAIFTWLICFWFFCLTTLSILRGIRTFTYTLNWWAFIFPNVGLVLALFKIAEQLGSRGMQGIGAGMTILLVAIWFVVAGATARALWRGDVLSVGKDMGVAEVNRGDGTGWRQRPKRGEDV